jgi:hypothetical protein
MKLQAPHGTTGELHLNGRSFVIDKKGQVDVPDNLIGQSVWQQGYTVVPEPEPNSVRADPVEARTQTSKDKV